MSLHIRRSTASRQVFAHLSTRRCLATSQRIAAPEAFEFSQYPPEHPKFIDIPRPMQPQQTPKPRVKGRLPVPRNLFPPSASRKTSEEYLAATIPEPQESDLSKNRNEAAQQQFLHKQGEADKRRRNFRESVVELHERKIQTARARGARGLKMREANRRARLAPEREDERLTRASIMQADQLPSKMAIQDPDREQTLAIKRENVAETQSGKVQERRDMLHTLYVNAGSFITTSEQLDKAIEQAFDDERLFENERSRGFNVWNLGPPDTTADLLGKKSPGNGRNSKALDDPQSNLLDERMRRIGEELTGGKG